MADNSVRSKRPTPYSDSSLTDEMPGLPFPVIPATVTPVALVADQRREYGVGDLTQQHEVAGHVVVEMNDPLEEDEEVTEPHGGAQVVEDMADPEGESL